MCYYEPTLFPTDWGEDNSPVDDTEIKQKIFYYSPEQWARVKKMAKKAMPDFFEDPFTDGNLSDLFEKMLEHHLNNKENGEDPTTETHYSQAPSGQPQQDLFG